VDPRAVLDTVVKRNIPSLHRESNPNPDRQGRCLVAIPTELSRLYIYIYIGSIEIRPRAVIGDLFFGHHTVTASSETCKLLRQRTLAVSRRIPQPSR
jgi:hypothetical protein